MLFSIDMLGFAFMLAGGILMLTGFLIPLGVLLMVIGFIFQTLSTIGLDWRRFKNE